MTELELKSLISFMPEACIHALIGNMPERNTSKTRARLIHGGLWQRISRKEIVRTPLGMEVAIYLMREKN